MMVQATNPTSLRIGIIIESFLQPRWVRKALENALATKLCMFVVAVKVEPQKGNGGNFLFKLYNRIDRRLFPTAANELVNVKDLFSEAAVAGDIDGLASFQLDLLLNFAALEWNVRVSDCAKHGVWFYAFGDAPGFSEVMHELPITHSSLRSRHGNTEKTIYHSDSPTLSRFSVSLNNNTCYWKSAAFVARGLRDLHAGENKLRTSHENTGPSMPPGAGAMSQMFLKLSSRAAARVIEKVSSFEQWMIAYRFDCDEFKYLVPPVGHFWADPFQLKVGGRYYIFFEDFVDSAGRAHISVLEVDRDGIVSGPTEVLKLDCHLSYPFVFEWRGDHYMIPETGERNVVELYRAHAFPFEWKLEEVLLEARCPLDATLVEAEGKWWMFVNIQEEGVAVNWDELHLFYAEVPLGPWNPHARNPVVSNVRSARPAGRLFWSEGVLYRPSQDSSLRYGYATTISKVASLSPLAYNETEVLKILPNWDEDIIGVHTVNLMDEMTVIDCLMKRRRFGKPSPEPVKGSLEVLSSANMKGSLLNS